MISDDRLTSWKVSAFVEKLLERHYWTADDYDSIPDDIVVEIFDGAVYMVPSPSIDHQITNSRLHNLLVEAVGDDRLVIQDYDVTVLGRIFKPDLLVLRTRSELRPMPGDLRQVVVEVISPNENIERTAKKKCYAEQGIPLYIVV